MSICYGKVGYFIGSSIVCSVSPINQGKQKGRDFIETFVRT